MQWMVVERASVGCDECVQRAVVCCCTCAVVLSCVWNLFLSYRAVRNGAHVLCCATNGSPLAVWCVVRCVLPNFHSAVCNLSYNQL